ncbi:MAG: hypothetical protein NZ853_06360 [Leptospiraceae bacterium]|nr:hypothetical protein [Leptospiraceae bacterium]MDW7976426.1 hypothetical protein [Leptospiraceae bacterium]
MKAKTLFKLVILMMAISSVWGDTFKINVGFWPGELEPELESRFFLDDLIQPGGLGRINLPWANKSTYTLYPFGFQYIMPVNKNRLVLTANLIGFSPDYRYNGINLAPAISIVELKDFDIDDLEGEVGFEFPLQQIILTPKFGVRYHEQTFQYNEITIGNALSLSIGDNQFEASALGTYLGLDFQIKVDNDISLVAEYLNTAFLPGFSGDMKFKKTIISLFGGFSVISIEDQTSNYDVKIERFKLGLRYNVNKNIDIEFGLRNETQTHSYPAYFSIPIIVSNVGTGIFLNPLFELITDLVFWQQEQEQKKGLLYFAVSFPFDS